MKEDITSTYRYYVPFYFPCKHSVENWADYWIVEIIVNNPCQLILVYGYTDLNTALQFPSEIKPAWYLFSARL